jgi:hypothetical protein
MSNSTPFRCDLPLPTELLDVIFTKVLTQALHTFCVSHHVATNPPQPDAELNVLWNLAWVSYRTREIWAAVVQRVLGTSLGSVDDSEAKYALPSRMIRVRGISLSVSLISVFKSFHTQALDFKNQIILTLQDGVYLRSETIHSIKSPLFRAYAVFLAVRNLWTVTLNGGYSTMNVYESNRQYVQTSLSVFPYLSGLGLDSGSGANSDSEGGGYWDIASLLMRAVDELSELCEKGYYSFVIPFIPPDNTRI